MTFIQPDAPRIGGITPFLKIAAMADHNFHLACSYPRERWVEHIEWLEPAFNERLHIEECQRHPDGLDTIVYKMRIIRFGI